MTTFTDHYTAQVAEIGDDRRSLRGLPDGGVGMRRALADVLDEAANVHLLASQADGYLSPLSAVYSCNAVNHALSGRGAWGVWLFLKSLGCDAGSCNYTFKQRAGPRRQGARYIWLLLAACVAEDEGIEVDA